MQEYTSLETSKKLFEMFGWELESSGLYLAKCWWSLDGAIQDFAIDRYKLMPDQVVAPAYTLTYLLDKLQLPYQIESHKHQNERKELGYDNYRIVCWPDRPGIDFINSDGSELVEAAALLCLELGKQGILPRKDSDDN